MAADEQHPDADTPRRFRRYPYGWSRMRLVYPVLAIVTGGGFAITRFGDPIGYFGLATAILGLVAIPVAVWMARRDL
ncbi:MAG: hypothetical protein ABWZ77_03375 [Naasia sp.]